VLHHDLIDILNWYNYALIFVIVTDTNKTRNYVEIYVFNILDYLSFKLLRNIDIEIKNKTISIIGKKYQKIILNSF
jgi:hypothetical protein